MILYFGNLISHKLEWIGNDCSPSARREPSPKSKPGFLPIDLKCALCYPAIGYPHPVFQLILCVLIGLRHLKLSLNHILRIREEPAEESPYSASNKPISNREVLLVYLLHSGYKFLGEKVRPKLSCVRRALSKDCWQHSFENSISKSFFLNDFGDAIKGTFVISVLFRLTLDLKSALDHVYWADYKWVNESSEHPWDHRLVKCKLLFWFDSESSFTKLVSCKNYWIDEGNWGYRRPNSLKESINTLISESLSHASYHTHLLLRWLHSDFH